MRTMDHRGGINENYRSLVELSHTHWALTTESKDAKVTTLFGMKQRPISPGTIFLLLPPKQQ